MVDSSSLIWRPDRVAHWPVDSGDVWLFGGPHPIRLAGRFAVPVAQAIDGERTMNQVAQFAATSGLLTTQQANAVLFQWLTAGHVVTRAKLPGSHLIRIVGDDEPQVRALRHALEATGAQVVLDNADLTVAVVDDLLNVAEQVDRGYWLPVRMRGDEVLVGPMLGPGHGCADCFVTRHECRRSVDLMSARLAGLDRPPVSPNLHPAAPALAAGIVTSIAQERRLGKTLTTHDDCRGINPVSLESRRHALVPVPGCRTCDPGGNSTVDLGRDLDRQLISSNDGGGLRTVEPETTWQSYEHLVSDVLGIVPEVCIVGDPTLRVHRAGLNPAWSQRQDLDGLRASLRQSAMGKGLTIASSRAGALAEALERQSMIWRGDETVRVARMDDLECAIHPHDIQLYSAAQIAAAELDGSPTHRFHYVPHTFPVDQEHTWSQVRGIADDRRAWIPTSIAYLGGPPTSPGSLRGCSNGVAAGNSVDEALLQGLLELVERDSVALWWYSRAHRPGIDLDAIDDPRVRAALAPLRARGREVWVLDITSDLSIPAMAALTSTPEGGRVLMGFGAHVDPVIAVVRALTEVCQSEAGLADWNAESMPEGVPEMEGEWLAAVTTATDPWLAPHGSAPLARASTLNLHESLDVVLAALSKAGLEAWWMDLTRRDIGLPVVRTVVPGLRHFWNRFAPGRLYDVPLKLGWVRDAYGEDDLNPRWVFL
jgi:bacteriocin biosynthesis cyclodehydratase domain-containing protein